MAATTTKGVPYPTGDDAASSLDTSVQALAEWVDAHPGISSVTTAQRDAIAGADRWTGRTVYNTDTDRHEYWDGTAWRPVVQTNFAVRFLTMGASNG